MAILIRAGVAVLFLAVAACGGPSGVVPAPPSGGPPATSGETAVSVDGGGAYTSVSPERLAMMLRAKDFTLVNVHLPYAGEIEPTDAFIPYDQIADGVAALPSAREAKIVVYCRSGRMSTIAAETLVRLGYANVFELGGGFDAWQAAGYPLAKRPGARTDGQAGLG